VIGEPPPEVARRFPIGGRLFWKFFLAFWIALLIAAGAVVSALYVYQQNQERRVSQVEQGPRADFRVGAAANVMIHGGSDALKAFLREEDAPPRTPILAVDAQGHDLLGRIVPPVALANARSIAREGRARAVREVGEGPERLLLFEPARFDSPEMREPRPLPPDVEQAPARPFTEWAGKTRTPPVPPQQRPPGRAARRPAPCRWRSPWPCRDRHVPLRVVCRVP